MSRASVGVAYLIGAVCADVQGQLSAAGASGVSGSGSSGVAWWRDWAYWRSIFSRSAL